MKPQSPQRGIALLALAVILALVAVTALTAAIARTATGPRRAAASDPALATAREALIAHATSRPLDEIVGPGYLPCPDLDDDGWAESTCGSLTGETGQWQRLGRLPWKTLGLPDLRDAFGERLWYAVSSKHKGLLNCTVSPACLDMGPEAALGTITVRDPAGTVIHDGTSASPYEPGTGGAVAVVFAPGPALARWAGNDAAPHPAIADLRRRSLRRRRAAASRNRRRSRRSAIPRTTSTARPAPHFPTRTTPASWTGTTRRAGPRIATASSTARSPTTTAACG